MALPIIDLPATIQFILHPLVDQLPAIQPILAAYSRRWNVSCVLVDIDGHIVDGDLRYASDCPNREECVNVRRLAIQEAVRWGEPSLMLCPQQYALWAAPLMINTQVIGGLVAAGVVSVSDQRALSPAQTRQAMAELLHHVVQANLTNPAFLALQQSVAARESERAEAIHALKGQDYRSIRDLYLVEEPVLIAAIKAGDRAVAREIINRMLVGIYFQGRARPALLKSFLLELVIMISRSAVEAGGDPTELLGANYSAFTELARIHSEEELCAWLVQMLEHAMDAISSHHRFPISVLLGAAVDYIHQHLQEELTRDEVAKVACLSPSHFSRVIKQTYGFSFTELVSRARVEKASELLVRTEKSLLQICMECGFNEQSYFTRVFQKHAGRPPGEYRKYQRSRYR